MQNWFNKWPNWLRWLMFLPIAFIAQGIIRITCFYVIPFVWSEILANITGTFVFIMACYIIVPSYKFLISLIFTILISVLSGGYIIIEIYDPYYHPIIAYIEGLSNIITSGVTLYIVYRLEMEAPKPEDFANRALHYQLSIDEMSEISKLATKEKNTYFAAREDGCPHSEALALAVQNNIEVGTELLFRFITVFSTALLPIITILNVFGGIVGGLWLLFSGEWLFVLLAFGISLIIPTVYSFTLMPIGFLFALPITYFTEKKKTALAIIFGAINMLVNNIVLLLWVIMVFAYMIDTAKVSGINAIPFLLFGWEVAIGPFTYMASKEPRDSFATFISVFFMQISYLLLGILYLLNILTLALPLIIILGITLLVFLLKLTHETSKRQEETGRLF